jgi:hypothetical protein
VDGSFTITDSDDTNSGVSIAVALSYLIQTTATAANPTLTFTGSAGGMAAAIATFKAASAAATPHFLGTLGVGG